MDKKTLQTIAAAVKVVPSSRTLPILSSVRLQAYQDCLTVTKTDLTTYLSIEIADGAPGMSGDVLVDGKLFADAVRAVNGDSSIHIGGGARIGSIRLQPSGDVADYPAAPDIPADRTTMFDVSTSIFRAVLAGPIEAASADESRFNLNGVFFNGAARQIIGTDGHRLALESPAWFPQGASALIPRFALAGVIKIADALKVKDLSIEFAGDTADAPGRAAIAVISGRNKGVRFEARIRLMSGDYPDYVEVIPTDVPEPVVIERAALESALAELKPFLEKDRVKCVAIEPGFSADEICLSISHPDRGGHAVTLTAVGGVPAQLVSEPAEKSVRGFNWWYIADMAATAKAAGETYIAARFHGDGSPCVFNQTTQGLHLIMPMRDATAWYPDAAAEPSTETTAPVEAPAETEPPAETPEPVAAPEPEPVSETPVESAPPVNDLRAEMIRRARNITAPPAMKKEPTVKTKPARETTKAARARVARENMRDGNRAHGIHERPAPVETPPEPAHEPAPPLPTPERRSIHWAPPKRTPEPAVLPPVVPARIVPKPEPAPPVDDTMVPIRVVDEPEPVERQAGFLAGFRKVRDMIREYLRPATPATVIEPLPEPVSAPVSETKDERERPSGRPAPTTTPEPKKSRKGIMRAKYDGICKVCGEPIEVGDEIRYYGRKWGAKHAGCDDRTEEQRRADSERARAHRRAYRRNAA